MLSMMNPVFVEMTFCKHMNTEIDFTVEESKKLGKVISSCATVA